MAAAGVSRIVVMVAAGVSFFVVVPKRYGRDADGEMRPVVETCAGDVAVVEGEAEGSY